MTPGRNEPAVASVRAEAFRVPTDAPESDGTLQWDATGLVVVHAEAGNAVGLGFAYTHPAAAAFIRTTLAPLVCGCGALGARAAWERMRHEVRNVGRPGMVSCALAAVDTALWDLQARLLDVSLATLFGRLRDAIPAYGSGGFTSYPLDRLRTQLRGWAERGMRMVKMKVGRASSDDARRVTAAREAIGPDVELFADANGAWTRKQALAWMYRLHDEYGVSWMEEPVSSNDLAGLRLLRDTGPPGMDVAAGEYGWDLTYFRDMLHAGAVDTVQVDVGRCGGYTEFLRIAALCDAHELPLSAHTAPALHTPIMCAVRRGIHVEWFHDHARIESMLFDGVPAPDDGLLRPSDGPGHGLTFKRADAEEFRVD